MNLNYFKRGTSCIYIISFNHRKMVLTTITYKINTFTLSINFIADSIDNDVGES